MEASGAVLRRAPLIPGGAPAGETPSSGRSAGRRTRVSMRPMGGGGFSDDGHLRYYLPEVRCGDRKKEEKKRTAKLVKGLSKDLSAFYSMGFGVGDGMVGDVKGKMMTEAAELLLSQLKQLRDEEKELKRKRKQEKKAMKAAARMKDCAEEDSSSSSSSESSDSDCETVVEMKALRTADVTEAKPEIRAVPLESPLELKAENCSALSPEQACSSTSSSNAMFASKGMEKIQVCMGGKCKKTGAPELLAEFEKMVGMEGAVVGCKCMGKCRDGPNVRVLSHSNQGEGDSVKASRNPLCIGVGLEDVGEIVSNFFGSNKDVGLLAA